MEKLKWTKFRKRIYIKAPVKVVYSYWTKQMELEKWFLRKAKYTLPTGEQRAENDRIQAGDHFKWMWHGYDDNAVENNEVLAANGTDQLQFGFTGKSVVTVTLKAEIDETLVELIQENIPLADTPASSLYIGCGDGWVFYLTNLKSILEGGIDLRNKNNEHKGVVNS